MSTSNYYRYRDSCHFSADKPLPNSLGYKTIVTMNMLAERDILLQDNALLMSDLLDTALKIRSLG